jgi:DNA polymerase III sliding clamp (beta) subunit (PCNA family)
VGATRGKERKMQMRVDRLREALKLLQPAVPRKTTVPVLENVILKDGQAVATDLEIMVILELPEAEGQCLIPHHPVLELLKYVPGNELLSIEQAKKKLELSWDDGKASYDATDPKGYPAVPEVKVKVEGELDGDSLSAALKSVVDYCSTDSAKPVLNGVDLSLGESLIVAGADGFQLAYKTLPMSFPAEEQVIIPARAVRVLCDLWDKAPPAVPLQNALVSQIMSKRQLSLALEEQENLKAQQKLVARFGRVTMMVKLIQGTAPNLKQLIPEDTPIKIRLFAPDLERAVRRVKDIAKDGSGIVRFIWTETSMTVSAKGKEKGSVEAQVAVQTEGEPGKVAVSVDYLLNYLKGRDGLVSIGVRGTQDPVLFRHGTSPLVLIMPMFAQW